MIRTTGWNPQAAGLTLGVCTAGLVAAAFLFGPTRAAARAQESDRREVAVTARRNAFDPVKIDVQQNDVVKITFTAEDGPHSFTIDEYRISKRARPGQPATFEFRADRPGTFRFYCTIATSGGERHDMHGDLIVRAR